MTVPDIPLAVLPEDVTADCNKMVSYFFNDCPKVNYSSTTRVREYVLVLATLTVNQLFEKQQEIRGKVLLLCIEKIHAKDYNPVSCLEGFLEGFYENDEKPLGEELGSLFINDQTAMFISESVKELGYT